MSDELMTHAEHRLWLAVVFTYGWMKDKVGMNRFSAASIRPFLMIPIYES